MTPTVRAKLTPAQNALLKLVRTHPGRLPAKRWHSATVAGLVNRGLVVIHDGWLVPIVPEETR